MKGRLIVFLITSHILLALVTREAWSDEPASAEANTTEEKEAAPVELHITGALSPIGLDRLGKPVSVIPHEKLQERSEPTVGELLGSEPGVSGTYFGPGASRPVIRGQSKQRVRVLENGLEIGDASDVSDDHAVSIDPLAVQRIDVLRGPSILLYGSNAIGGVVNMIDQSIAEDPVGKPITGEIDLRKGDEADDEYSGATALNGQVEDFNWHLSGFYRETDDIEIPGFAESDRLREMEAAGEHHHEDEDGHLEGEEHGEESGEEEIRRTLENSDTLSKGFKVGGSHVWSKGYTGFALRLLDSEYGIPGGHHHHAEEEEHHGDEDSHSDEHEHEGESEEVLPRIDLEQIRMESRGEVQMDDSFFKAVRFGAAYSIYEHKELEGGETATKFDKDSLEGRIELTHRHEDGFQGGWGTQLRYDDFKAQGEEAFLPPSETFTPAIFAVEDYKLSDALVWQLGGRYEYAHVDAEEQSTRDFHMVSASTGPVYNLDSDGVYTTGLTFSYSERAPASTELFADGAHLATQSFEIGDPDLDKEQAVGAEIVGRKNYGRLTGQTSAFWQHYFDYINLTPNGEEREELPVFLYEMDRARLWGFEVEADYELLSHQMHAVHLYGQCDYVRGENLSEDESLPRITPFRTKVGLKYVTENASAYVESLFVNEQDETAEFELPTDNYSLLSVGVAYQLPLDGEKTYELYARGTNLTDEEARVHNSFLKDVAPLRGRAFFVGLRLAF